MSVKDQDCYAVLGVKPAATATEIKHAYWELSDAFHPDKNPDPAAIDRLVEVQDAYSVLRDPKKKAEYDAAHRKSAWAEWNAKEKSRSSARNSKRSSSFHTGQATADKTSARTSAAEEAAKASTAEPAPITHEMTVAAETSPGTYGGSRIMKASAGTVEAGMGAAGLVLGVMGARNALRESDVAGATLSGANAALSAAQLGAPLVAKVGGKALLEKIPVIGAVVMAADGAHQIIHEKGDFIDKEADGSHTLGNKGERAAAVVTNLAAGGVSIAAIAAGASILPVVGAGVGIGLIVEKDIELHRATKELNREIDHTNAENAKAVKRDVEVKGAGEGPSIYPYKHIGVELLRVSGDMKDANMTGNPERTKDGKISIKELSGHKLDMRDPKNIAEFESALKINMDKQKAIAEGKAPGDVDTAKMTLAGMTGAKAEMALYKKELSDYRDSPAGQRAAAAAVEKQVQARGGAAQTPAKKAHHQDHSHKATLKTLTDTGKLDKNEAKQFIQDVKQELTNQGHHIVDGGQKSEWLIAKTVLKKMGYNTRDAICMYEDAKADLKGLPKAQAMMAENKSSKAPSTRPPPVIV